MWALVTSYSWRKGLVNTYKYLPIFTNMLHVYTWKHIYTYIYIYIRIYTHIHIYIRVCVCVCACVYIQLMYCVQKCLCICIQYTASQQRWAENVLILDLSNGNVYTSHSVDLQLTTALLIKSLCWFWSKFLGNSK